jgi:hypothetical protein
LTAAARLAFAIAPTAAIRFGHRAHNGRLDAAFGAFEVVSVHKMIILATAVATVFEAVGNV